MGDSKTAQRRLDRRVVSAQLLRHRRRMMAVRGQLTGQRVLFAELARSGSSAPPDGSWWINDRLEAAISGAREAADYALAGSWSLSEKSRDRVRELGIALLAAWITLVGLVVIIRLASIGRAERHRSAPVRGRAARRPLGGRARRGRASPMAVEIRPRMGTPPVTGQDARPTDGSVTIVALRRGKVTETHDADALHDLLADSETRVWIDLTDPSPDVVESIGAHDRAASARRRGHHREQRAGEDRARRRHHPHRDVRADARRTRCRPWRSTSCSASVSCCPCIRGSWDPRSVHQLKLGLEAILGRGLDFLLWALLDGIVDGYFPIFDSYADEIDEVQDDIIDDPSKEALQKVFQLKRDLIRLRHVVHPSREIFSRLTSREFELIGDAQVFYFRDVYDHLIRLTDEFDSLRELAAGALEVYLSTINNNLSAIMKRLTGVTVVLAGIAAIGGLFGMSEAPPALRERGLRLLGDHHRHPRPRRDRGRVPAQDRLDLADASRSAIPSPAVTVGAGAGSGARPRCGRPRRCGSRGAPRSRASSGSRLRR